MDRGPCRRRTADLYIELSRAVVTLLLRLSGVASRIETRVDLYHVWVTVYVPW